MDAAAHYYISNGLSCDNKKNEKKRRSEKSPLFQVPEQHCSYRN